MRWRILLFFAALNALVLACGFFVLDRLEVARQARVRTAAATSKTAAKTALRPPAIPPNVRTVIVHQTNQFHWSELESADYRQYIANLRRVGCPEATIRDIIMTDVMRLYAQRKGRFAHNGRPFHYWETDDKRALKHDQLDERDRQLAEINRDLPAVLRELLGVNYQREVDKYFTDDAKEDRRLAFLSDDKRAQALAVRDQFEARRERVLAAHDGRADNADLSPAEIEQLRQLGREQADALKNVLTPEEREQYTFAMSSTGDDLRKELVGFNPSEAEFREIYERRQKIDDKYQYANLDDPAVSAAKDADQAQMDQELASVLSPERLAAYDQSKDPGFRELCGFAQEYDLSAESTRDLQGMRNVAEEQTRQVLSDNHLSPEQRQAALDAIQIETRRALRQTVGDKAWEDYLRGPGVWVKDIVPKQTPQ